MDVTLLGTGCPQCDPDRLGPASLVRHGAVELLFDCGSGVTQRLVAAGSSGARIDALFLTHLHTDHLVDFYQLVISSWHQGRDRPQRVFGPPGTREFVEGSMALWAAERAQRIAHERRPSVRAFDLEVTELADGAAVAFDSVSVTAVAVDHLPVRAAFGFVVRGAGRTIVLSGDTRRCAALIEAARGADVLVHECFIHREMKPSPSRSAEGMRNVAAYHTLSGEVGGIAAEAGVRCLVLNHFVPTRFDRDALLAEVRRGWSGPLVIGEDLVRLDAETLALSWRGLTLGLAGAA